MNLGIIGQCQGGNAVLWFELFNKHLSDYREITNLEYICRNENELQADFQIKELYGKKSKSINKYFQIAKILCYSKISNKIYFKFTFPRKKFDVIHIQGNYNPAFNLQIIQNTKAKIVLQIMGSDFYQNYVNERSGEKDRVQFIEVLKRVDRVVCSRESSKKDLLDLFPFIENKLSVIRLGTSRKWLDVPIPNSQEFSQKKKPLVFLSTRGLYNYNNVDLLVEAFCKVYKDRKEGSAVLHVLNGYGNNESTIRKVKSIVKKYSCEDIVNLVINEWVSEEDLMDYYRISDYNFCLGSTDQLSISITYGLITTSTNVLSPIDTYYELQDSGYKSLHILEKVATENLVSFFESPPKRSYDDLILDRTKASKEQVATENFKKFISVYKESLYDSKGGDA
jgi:glycosyltransferase involved in cell wall biosynthesis